MPEVIVVMFDNLLPNQSQDYLPSRMVLQKEIIDVIITRVLENDKESLIGLIPIAQKVNNDILTPTSVRIHLSTFMDKQDYYSKPNHNLCLFQADHSLLVSELSTKTLIIFLSSNIENFEEVFGNIYNIASKGISVKVICFAEAIGFGEFIKEEITYSTFGVLILNPNDDFEFKITDFLGNSSASVDPEFEEAIRRSLQE